MQENSTTRKISVHLLGKLVRLVEDKHFVKENIITIMYKFLQDFNFEIRRIACSYIDALCIDEEEQARVLSELLELVDDEENLVRIEAIQMIG